MHQIGGRVNLKDNKQHRCNFGGHFGSSHDLQFLFVFEKCISVAYAGWHFWDRLQTCDHHCWRHAFRRGGVGVGNSCWAARGPDGRKQESEEYSSQKSKDFLFLNVRVESEATEETKSLWFSRESANSCCASLSTLQVLLDFTDIVFERVILFRPFKKRKSLGFCEG